MKVLDLLYGALSKVGLRPSENDLKLKSITSNCYATTKIVGRGGLSINLSEVRKSDEFKEGLMRARLIVESHKIKKHKN